jgi:dimethylhistidine N-methyltransferase
MAKTTATAYRFYNASMESDDFYQAVVEGFSTHPRSVPPKFFYDLEGSRLFEAICEQPEYYPTRTEIGLLEQYAVEIAALAGTDCYLVEPGSGSCEKVRLLLDALRPASYIPMDISGEHLDAAAAELAADYPWLDVHAVCADITGDVALPFIPEHVAPVFFYPGSSIGNFEPDAAVGFLEHLAGIAGKGGGLLIGVDLKKDAGILNAAYNDANGVTAAFNLNILRRVNYQLEGDFDLDAFDHHAFYNNVKGRIEMHLISTRKQSASIDGHTFEFNAGDSIHTESSYKYTTGEFQALAQQGGWSPCSVWTDRNSLFSLHFLRVE